MSRLNRYLFGTVFLTGASVLVLEVVAVRVLSPHYGSSLYVFSSVLTIILAALSFGYFYGGRRADRKHSLDELYGIIAISGLIVLILLLAAKLVLPPLAPRFSVISGPLVFSLLLFFLPAFLLGIVSPYVIKLQSLTTPQEHIGAVVGSTFFWGTIGSIVGSLASGFWFIPAIGVDLTIALVSVVLLTLGLVTPIFLDRPLRSRLVLPVLALSLTVAALLYLEHQKDTEEYVYAGDGLYSSIVIDDRTINGRTIRTMHRDTNNSSAIYLDSTDLVFRYSQFAPLYDELTPGAKRFLLLGGGAYTIPRTLTAKDPELMVDVVEIEPALYALSQQYMDFTPTDQVRNFTGDARAHLARHKGRYDTIFLDAFGTDTAPPFHLTTVEFFTLVRDRLNREGVFMMNVIAEPKTIRPSLFGSLMKTVLQVFPNATAYAIDAHDLSTLQNIMIIARNGEAPIVVDNATIKHYSGSEVPIRQLQLDLSTYDFSEELLLTDNHAPVEYLMVKQW